MQGILLFLHLLGATIWTGGHIVLSVVVLPGALRDRAPERLLAFESVYEKIGMPALVVQVVTGIWLASLMLAGPAAWLDPANPVTRVVALKLVLLALTLGFAISARWRVLPRLSPATLPLMAWHIVPVTLISILFVFVGVSFRTGWLY